jgi:hypothetical protein
MGELQFGHGFEFVTNHKLLAASSNSALVSRILSGLTSDILDIH